jgi:hypothetical protein
LPKRKQRTLDRVGTSYIVRVYRCDAHGIAGVVEMPLQERRAAFRSFTELEAILTGASVSRSRARNQG